MSRYRFCLLLSSLLLLLVVVPLTTGNTPIDLLLTALLSYVLLTSIVALSGNRYYLVIGLFLALPYLFLNWVYSFFPALFVERAALSNGSIFFFYTAIALVLNLLRQRAVTHETIAAALAVYLLLGFCWASLYGLIESLWPGSFSPQSSGITDPRYRFIYFSFVTLTTLGYGDITPATPLAQSWTILEAIIGQLYLVVIIASLVGAYISSGTKSSR